MNPECKNMDNNDLLNQFINENDDDLIKKFASTKLNLEGSPAKLAE